MPAGHLNIVNPGLEIKQIQRTLPVNDAETGIVRGSCVVVDSGTWRRSVAATDGGAANSPGAIAYWALQDQGQPDVAKAGGLTAVPCTTQLQIETDQFAAGGTFPDGGFLAVDDDGVVTDHADDQTAIGVVVKSPYNRWVNDRIHSAGQRQGQYVSVIQFYTIYNTNLSTS